PSRQRTGRQGGIVILARISGIRAAGIDVRHTLLLSFMEPSLKEFVVQRPHVVFEPGNELALVLPFVADRHTRGVSSQVVHGEAPKSVTKLKRSPISSTRTRKLPTCPEKP